MKKLLVFIFLASILLGAVPIVTVAQGSQNVEDSIRKNLNPIEDVYSPVDDPQPGSLQTIIAKVIRQLLAFLGIVFILLIIYGGWKWMTSAGNESAIDSAKGIITAAIIGLAIILVAYAIAQFVFTQLLHATGVK